MTNAGIGLISRFEGEAGVRRLLAALRSQRLLEGSDAMAEALQGAGRIRSVESGEAIIVEGDATNEIFFIVAGAFSIRVKGSEVAVRGVGTHVGEQALLDPAQARTASVVALEQSIVFEVDEPSFERFANAHPEAWKRIARELSARLIQRNRLIRNANEQVQIFIISARESLWIAEEVRAKLNGADVLCTVWTDGVFRAGEYALEALESR